MTRSRLIALVLMAGAVLLPGCAREDSASTAGAAGKPSAGAGWQSLFDGKSLAGWRQSGFEGEGNVRVVAPFQGDAAAIVLERGTTLSGITWIDGARLPRTNYELTLEAMRVAGGDFFCGVTFPVGPAACTFVVGGWGGEVVGISSLDRLDASENETTREMQFRDNRWYRVLIRVTDRTIAAWIDGQPMVDVKTQGRTISLRPGDIQKSLPLGIASYMTTAAIRDIRLRKLGNE